MNTVRHRVRSHRYAWLAGFFGFYGFMYFRTGDPGSLFYFSFFSFFAYYFVGKLADQMPDERYVENSQRAKLTVAWIPMITLFVVGFAAGFPAVTREIIITVCALGWAATIISYGLLFWHYDQH